MRVVDRFLDYGFASANQDNKILLHLKSVTISIKKQEKQWKGF